MKRWSDHSQGERDAVIAYARVIIGVRNPERINWRRLAGHVGVSVYALQKELRPGYFERARSLRKTSHERRPSK